MINIDNARVQLRTDNRFYQTIVNARFSDQTYETISALGTPTTNTDEYVYEYELSDHILVILWK